MSGHLFIYFNYLKGPEVVVRKNAVKMLFLKIP